MVPYRFERTRDAASLREQFADLEPGAETGVIESVAGRVMLTRPTGKLAFHTLHDSSGSVQLFGGKAWTAELEAFSKLSQGDWIGASGEVVTTRTGEVSVKVASWQLLAEARRGFGDKWK